MYQDRQFQNDIEHDLYRSWDAGHNSTMIVSPTGSGKTYMMSRIAKTVNAPMCAIAHRAELVQQISMAMAKLDIPHNIIAPEKTISVIINQHINECGMSYLDRRGQMTVAGVNALNAREDKLKQWANTIRYWAGDECHHFQETNQWGRAVKTFRNARGVGFTATPLRCDRKSLARSQGGCFDDMVVGPSIRELINDGYLSDYRIFGPPVSIDVSRVKVSKATGDFSNPSLREASKGSTITGDIVQHYLKIAPGKRGITFVVDVDAATKTAQMFRNAGVPAEAVSAKTPDAVRNAVIDQFRRGEILQLVNVDLFGEGFDVPAVEVVSMGRPTQSLGLYIQQFGRALRVLPGKSHGIIIDHVGNVKRHGLPDASRQWQLVMDHRAVSGDDPYVMPVTTCLNCMQSYEAVTKICPFCGTERVPDSRGEPKFVEGDLVEFSPELLAQLRGEIDAIDAPFDPQTDVPDALKGKPAARAIAKNYGNRQMAQDELRKTIALWAGIRRDRGMGDSEIYRRFYHAHGVDILSAQAIREATAINKLTQTVREGYWR